MGWRRGQEDRRGQEGTGGRLGSPGIPGVPPGTRGWQSKVQVPGAAERGRGLPPPGASEKEEEITNRAEIGGFFNPKTGHKARSGCFWGKTPGMGTGSSNPGSEATTDPATAQPGFSSFPACPRPPLELSHFPFSGLAELSRHWRWGMWERGPWRDRDKLLLHPHPEGPRGLPGGAVRQENPITPNPATGGAPRVT